MNEIIEKRPEEYAPTLSTSMVLVELHQRVPTFRKLDKTQTAKVNYDAKAHRDTASVNKKYLKCDELTAVNKVKADQYKFHIGSTIPWLDGGIRGLYNKFYQGYMVEMGGWTTLWRSWKCTHGRRHNHKHAWVRCTTRVCIRLKISCVDGSE